MAKPENIVVEISVAAPLAKVWAAYTTPKDIMIWNTAHESWHTTNATVELREGGAFSSRMEAKDGSMGFDFAGTYTKIIPEKLIAYAFGDRQATIEFSQNSDAVAVVVNFEPEAENPIEMQKGGWQAILNNFKKYVEALA